MKTYPASFALCLSIAFVTELGTNVSSAQSHSYFGGIYIENFDSMGTGNVTPANWFVGLGSDAGSTFVVASDGSAVPLPETTAYNFGSTTANPGDRALGSSAAGGNRNIEVRIRNDSGREIQSFTITYDGEQWRVGNIPNPTALTLRYSTDGQTYVDMGANFNFTSPRTAVPPLFENTALDGNLTANRTAGLGGTYSPSQPIPNGNTVYLRWVDTDENGSDPGLAIDNFSFSVGAMSGPPVAIRNNHDGTVTVSWAFPSAGYLLESTPQLNAPIWTTAADGVDVPANANHNVTFNTSTGAERYFRLRNSLATP